MNEKAAGVAQETSGEASGSALLGLPRSRQAKVLNKDSEHSGGDSGLLLRVWVPGVPKGQPRVKAYVRGKHAGVYTPSTAAQWRDDVARAVGSAPTIGTWPVVGPVAVEVQCYLPRPKSHFRKDWALKPTAPAWCTTKPDVDNVLKLILDVLTTCLVWMDDAQVVQTSVVKKYANVHVGAVVTVTTARLT